MGRRRWMVGVVVLAALATACTGTPPPDAGTTEQVWCADRQGEVDTVTYSGHDGDLTSIDHRRISFGAGSVTDEDLRDACRHRLARLVPLGRRTVCEAYAPIEAVEHLADQEQINAVHGEPGAERPGLPVVLRGDVDCEGITLQAVSVDGSGPPTADRLRAWNGADDLERFREVENRLEAAAAERCLDVDQARELALDAREDLPGDWPVLESTRDAGDPSHDGLCFEVRFHRAGVLRLDYGSGPIRP